MPTRILLIEDNPGDALIFREKLNESDLDYELVHTARLEEGLDLLAEGTFDLILCDLSLPDASGLEAVVRVRRAAPNQPIIVLTGLDDATTAATARNEGAIDYLVKWYQDGPTLARYIRYAIAQGRMEQEGTPELSSRIRGTKAEFDERDAPEPPAKQPAKPRRRAHGLEEAVARAAVGLAVIGDAGKVLYANEQARAWIGEADTYPWRVDDEAGRVAVDGVELDQTARPTRWNGDDATVVTLQPSGPGADSAHTDLSLLRQSLKAALAFIDHSERRSRWMKDVLTAAIDLDQQFSSGVEPNFGQINLLDRAQHVVREYREAAMDRGLAVRVRSARDKIMATGDRNVVDAIFRRLILDALLTARPSGVEIDLQIEGPVSVVVLRWESAQEEWSAVAPGSRTLARGLVERMVARLNGRCTFANTDGSEMVSLRFPSRTGTAS